MKSSYLFHRTQHSLERKTHFDIFRPPTNYPNELPKFLLLFFNISQEEDVRKR